MEKKIVLSVLVPLLRLQRLMGKVLVQKCNFAIKDGTQPLLMAGERVPPALKSRIDQ